MKKLVLVIMTVTLLGGMPAIAQKGFYIGAGATGMSTWIQNQNNYGLPDLGYRLTLAMKGNLNLGYDFSDHIGVKLEIGYGKFGQKYGDTQKDTVYDRRINLNYLMIPVMLKYYTGGDIAKFYLLAGLEFAILTSANQTYLKGGSQDTVMVYNDKLDKWYMVGQKNIKERFKAADVLVRIDLGADIYFTKKLFLNAGLTLSYGPFVDINNEDYHARDYKITNYHPSHNFYCGINIGLCYKFTKD